MLENECPSESFSQPAACAAFFPTTEPPSDLFRACLSRELPLQIPSGFHLLDVALVKLPFQLGLYMYTLPAARAGSEAAATCAVFGGAAAELQGHGSSQLRCPWLGGSVLMPVPQTPLRVCTSWRRAVTAGASWRHQGAHAALMLSSCCMIGNADAFNGEYAPLPTAWAGQPWPSLWPCWRWLACSGHAPQRVKTVSSSPASKMQQRTAPRCRRRRRRRRPTHMYACALTPPCPRSLQLLGAARPPGAVQQHNQHRLRRAVHLPGHLSRFKSPYHAAPACAWLPAAPCCSLPLSRAGLPVPCVQLRAAMQAFKGVPEMIGKMGAGVMTGINGAPAAPAASDWQLP